jgi:hypothetical protein
MGKSWVVSLVVGLGLANGGLVYADDGAPPLKGQPAPQPAPTPPSPPTDPSTDATVEVASVRVFDGRALGRVDPAVQKLIAGIEEGCRDRFMSREGPSLADQRRCDAAVARLTARGRGAAPAMFEWLNDSDTKFGYARTRVFFALSKIDDPKVRETLLAGAERIVREKREEFGADLWTLDGTLRGMFGAGPAVDAPWVEAAVADDWQSHALEVERWRAFAVASGPKRRSTLRAEALRSARATKSDDDPIRAYQAIAALLELAPREARPAAAAYAKRVTDAPVRDAFESLESEATWRLGSKRS